MMKTSNDEQVRIQKRTRDYLIIRVAFIPFVLNKRSFSLTAMAPPPPQEVVQFLNQKYRKPQVDPVSIEFVLSTTFSLAQLAGLA